jgi:putative endonuclease
MFYFYVLQSKKDYDFYFGFTYDLKNRFTEHNSGKAQATKSRRPFILVYYEAYRYKEEAKHREYTIKLNGRAKSQLLKRIEKSALPKPR